MKKRLVSLILCLTFLFSFFVFSTPVKVEAATIVESTSDAVDVDSVKLIDGEGYFIDNKNLKTLTFYYTKYLGNEVDFKENESVYVKEIRISSLPRSWTNDGTGLNPIGLGTVGISNGKWSLLKDYVRDFNGSIIPNSFGYLQDSVFSDCRKYVYYLSYRNEDGIDRPIYNKHYEVDLEIENIPDYILTDDGKNEIMGVFDGSCYMTEIVKYRAIKQIDYFEEIAYGSKELDNINADPYLYPIIYFNINDIDYDYLLSVEFSYKVLEHNYNWFTGYSEKIVKEYDFKDEVLFDEMLSYRDEFASYYDYYLALQGVGAFPETRFNLFLNYINVAKWFYIYHGTSDYKALETSVWVKEDSSGIEKTYSNRIVGHLTDLKADVSFTGAFKQKYTLENNSVKFLSVSYVYDGLLYTNDERFPINSNDETPDDVFDTNLYDKIMNDINDFLTKLPSNIVNTGVDLGKNALINFWNNLSGTSKTVIIIIIVILVLVFTFPLWYTLITKIIFINDETSKQQSFRMFNNRALNKHVRKERKYEKKMYLRQKNDSDSEYYRRRNDLMEDRDYISNRVDKKYNHETNLAEIKSRGYSVQHHHNDYTVTHKLANIKNRTKYDIPGDRKIKKTAGWYKNYKDQEFAKLKKQNKNNSNESIEDLDKFFNKK